MKKTKNLMYSFVGGPQIKTEKNYYGALITKKQYNVRPIDNCIKTIRNRNLPY
jgi:hypothetical protein